MKKMIKNLMLVAVAAMAFVACSEVSVEVDNLTKKTIITGVATIDTDDTRSGFVGSETVENEDGTTSTVYKSAWDGGEEIKIFYDSQETTTTIDDEGKGKFNVELEGTPGFIDICSPAEAWVSTYTCNIPDEQTPRANSVDPAAHILKAQNVSVSNGSAFAQMAHQVGYGKMTVNTPAEFVIDYVEVELNGDWYDYAKTLNYTINADNVEGNVFWFATDVVEVSDFTVTAYDAEGNAYTKSVTIPEGRELKFQYGRVSTFSVSNLEEVVVPAFTSENTMYADSSYNYVDEVISYSDVVLIFSSEELGTLQLNFYNAFEGFFITPGTFIVGELIWSGGGTQYSYYKPAGSETAYQLNGGSVIVSVTEDKKYHFEFKDITYNGTNTLNATYTGDIDGFGMPDTREKLPVPVVNTPTVNGKEITLTWSDVNGADGYYVYCAQDNTINTTTTEHTATFTMPAYETPYTFYIKAIANDDNPTYRSSDETYFTTVDTGRDPNKFADYEYTSLVWNSTKFELDGVTIFTMNANDRPNNNSIKPGLYSYAGNSNSTPDTGKFSLSKVEGSYAGSTWNIFNASMEVAFEDNQYIIKITIISAGASPILGKTFGYRGMPEGWVAPGSSEGGEEPEQPTELTALDTPVVTAAASETENSITVSWGEVANAAGYKVTFNGNTETVTALTKTYTGLDWGKKYDVEVVAVAATDSEEYKDSEAGTASATTIADPNAGDMKIVELTSVTFNGSVATFNDGALSFKLTRPSAYVYNGTYNLVAEDSSTPLTASDIKIDGQPATVASGTVDVNYSQVTWFITFTFGDNVVIDGVKYIGSPSVYY